MKFKGDKLKFLGLLAIILIPIPSILGLLHKGFFDPHDMHHLADIYEMFMAISSGQIPPRLGPDFSFGYTYPLFNYYYLLPFYIGAFLYFLSGSLTLSFKLVLVLSMTLSYFGMYKFLKLHFNKLASIAGAALFVYTPYRAVQVYVRGSLGEVLALSLLPWALYFVGKYLKTLNNKYLSIGSFMFFLLVISHNYFFALSIPIIVLYSWVLLKHLGTPVKRIFGTLLMLILGIGTASYWIIPALLEKKLVRGETPFLLADHFPFLKQLLLPSWGYGSSVWGPTDEISFQIGVINLLAVLGLCYILLKHWKSGKLQKHSKWFYAFILGGFIISFIFMNIRSLPIWNIIPFHDLIQFPWRLLNFTTFFSSIGLAAIINFLKPSTQKFMFIISLFSMFWVSYLYFHPAKYFYKSDQEYLNLFFNTPGYSEDYLLLPHWVEKRPKEKAGSFFESDNATIVNQVKSGVLEWRAEIESSEESMVVSNVYYFPGWQVLVNGEIAKIDKVGTFGKIGFNVPKGRSDVLVSWTETPFRLKTDIVSVVFIFGIVLLYRRSNKLFV